MKKLSEYFTRLSYNCMIYWLPKMGPDIRKQRAVRDPQAPRDGM